MNDTDEALTDFHARGLERTGNLIRRHGTADSHRFGGCIDVDCVEEAQVEVDSALQPS